MRRNLVSGQTFAHEAADHARIDICSWSTLDETDNNFIAVPFASDDRRIQHLGVRIQLCFDFYRVDVEPGFDDQLLCSSFYVEDPAPGLANDVARVHKSVLVEDCRRCLRVSEVSKHDIRAPYPKFSWFTARNLISVVVDNFYFDAADWCAKINFV